MGQGLQTWQRVSSADASDSHVGEEKDARACRAALAAAARDALAVGSEQELS